MWCFFCIEVHCWGPCGIMTSFPGTMTSTLWPTLLIETPYVKRCPSWAISLICIARWDNGGNSSGLELTHFLINISDGHALTFSSIKKTHRIFSTSLRSIETRLFSQRKTSSLSVGIHLPEQCSLCLADYNRWWKRTTPWERVHLQNTHTSWNHSPPRTGGWLSLADDFMVCFLLFTGESRGMLSWRN